MQENNQNQNQGLIFLTMLGNALKEKQMRNPNYSQRALARDLGVNQADLSQILKSKKQMSKNMANKILSSLPWTDDEKKQFIESYLWSWWQRQ